MLEDINTMVTTSDTQGDIFKDNQTVRVMDQIANDITYITTEQGKAVSSSGSAAASLAVGDKVKLASNAPVYGSSKKFSSWVYSSTLYVREISGNRVVISTQKTGAVTGAVDKKYLTKI